MWVVNSRKDKVVMVHGGDIVSVPLSRGKHEVSVRINSQTFKAFKRKISVDDNNYRLKAIKDKDKDYSWGRTSSDPLFWGGMALSI